jgi:alpha-N-arabinofuranosidase
MYVPFQDAILVPIRLDRQPYVHGEVEIQRVDAIAARDKGGKVWIAIANVDPRRAVRIRIASNGQKNGTLRGETLAAPKIDSVNTFDAPNTVAPKSVTAERTGGVMTLELAPASVTVVSLGS